MAKKDYDGNENKLDDWEYLKQMELEYSLLNTLNNSVEQKAYAMIGAIGVILTIQTSVIIYLYPFKCDINLNLLLLIIFAISSLAHVLSIWLFLRNLHVKDYEILPSADAIVDYYEMEYSKDEFIQVMLGNYQCAINKNLKFVKNKSNSSKTGFYTFEVGLIMLIIFFGGYLIL